MFGECYRPSVRKRRECYDHHRQEARANKQMLRGFFRCTRRKSPSQCSNYSSLKFTKLVHSVFSQHLSSTHSIPHNKLIRPAHPLSDLGWRNECSRTWLPRAIHPGIHSRPCLGYAWSYLKAWNVATPVQFKDTPLFFLSAMWGASLLITLTATNANNQSTQLARFSISGDREVCPEARWFVLLCLPQVKMHTENILSCNTLELGKSQIWF